MCYKSPGPRCSSHAKMALDKAVRDLQDAYWNRSQDADGVDDAYAKMRKAQDDYDMTPEGQEELRGMIQHPGMKLKHHLLELRLERGINLRQAALNQIKAEDVGDNDNHTMSEYAIQSLNDSEGFPMMEVKKVINKFSTAHGEPIGRGRTRLVFDRGDGYVLKVPLNWEGITDSYNESEWSSEYIPVAKCHIEELGEVPVLVMEKVSIVQRDFKELPDWTMSVDCQQVGLNSKGQLVAFDL